MSAQILNIRDYRRKEEKQPETLEQMAISMVDQFNAMAEPGTEVVCEMSPCTVEVIDRMFGGYQAPPEDCA